MKVLIVGNRVRTYALAFKNEIVPLLSLGHEIVWAADFSNYIGDRSEIPCKTVQIDIVSYPFHKTNLRAYKQIKTIIRNDKIEAVSCSTPIGGTLARIAAWQCGLDKNVIYAAHGFLFFKGVPLLKREMFRLHERILARITDTLITITNEDYIAAQKFRTRRGGKVFLVHGAGVNVGLYSERDRQQMRNEMGLSANDIAIISAGDLNENKNNIVVIRALVTMKSNIHYFICGLGQKEEYLKEQVNILGIENRVHFLGYRTDMKDLMAASDIFVMPSFREGVPRSILEAMDLGLPCVGSRTRGIADLIDEGEGGFLCSPSRSEEFAKALTTLSATKELRERYGEHNKGKVQKYSAEVVQGELLEIYRNAIR